MQWMLPFSTDYTHNVPYLKKHLLVGSCFAQEIGERMRRDAFSVTINPHGILFNPLSIASLIRCYSGESIDAQITTHRDMHMALAFHGSFRHTDRLKLDEHIQQAIEKGRNALEESHTIFITWGSAWVYECVATHHIVGNCHKLPTAMFRKRMLMVDEIVSEYIPLIETLLKQGKQIVGTISPVRYIKDGLHENNLSKSTLHLAWYQLQQRFQELSYFPAFEIVVDQLRDYRFYKTDMIHPNEQAIDYVYERWIDCSLSPADKQIWKEVRNYNALLSHKVLHPDSEEAQVLFQKIKATKESLKQAYPKLPLV